ncbi:MAG: phosphotransferase [Clostridia bacterium]|nr:phosphotransferase [Clostridia bacterium]
MEKIIELSGRIDSNNVEDVEKTVEQEINDFNGELIFDAKKLEYISSAGLRMILRFKKKNDTTKVINCKSEVYEVFEMTGFTEMMDISKALREISIDGCEKIGEGFYGVVYRIDPETIVKVYKKGNSIDSVKREIELARKAFVMGIPTAIPYDIVKVGDLYGSVFELLNSESLQKLIVDGADIDKLVQESVEVLKKIHSTTLSSNELPSQKENKISWVKDCANYLSAETVQQLIQWLESIPETNTMLHGDFHIKNMMLQNGELLLIDMDTLSLGHPIFELGAIYATYLGFACVNHNNPQEFLGITYEQSKKILDLTFDYYFEGKSQEYKEKVMEEASIISYLEVLWLRTRFIEKNNETQKQEIEFCIDYLTENLPKINSLVF